MALAVVAAEFNKYISWDESWMALFQKKSHFSSHSSTWRYERRHSNKLIEKWCLPSYDIMPYLTKLSQRFVFYTTSLHARFTFNDKNQSLLLSPRPVNSLLSAFHKLLEACDGLWLLCACGASQYLYYSRRKPHKLIRATSLHKFLKACEKPLTSF